MTTINTKLGAIRGAQQNGVQVFKGVRFGQAPTAERRFKAALPVEPWNDEYDATEWGYRSLQIDQPLTAGPGEQSEDCLFLNVYTPNAVQGSRPVLVWVHGGAFTLGSASQYDGSTLAAQGDVVVVAVNYRLGILGFLDVSELGPEYAGSASNGIRDQIAALEWVRDNIADYGGDPDNVTIFGESAGGASINCLLAAPAADGLYHRAIAHSAGTPSTGPANGVGALARHLDSNREDVLERLQTMPADDVLALQSASGVAGGSVIDGTVVTRSTPQALAERGANGVPYIAGSNRDEGTLFTSMGGEDVDQTALLNSMGMMIARATMAGEDPSQYVTALRAAYPEADDEQIHIRIWNDMFRRASINNAEAATAAGAGGWLYRFDLPATAMGGNLGATHASEISFTFNSYAAGATNAMTFHKADDPGVRELAKCWSDTVLQFAKTGNPNGAGLPEWPQYDTDTRQSLVLDAQSYIGDATIDKLHRELWGDA